MSPPSDGNAVPRSRYLLCAGREVHFLDWGSDHSEVVVAWHGLARSGRDMDELGAYLSRRYRVLCPDTIGRGLSAWSPEPAREYCFDFYVQLAVSLLDQLGIAEVHWVGTSMGGVLGMVAAAGALHGRIRRLLLNDIGPELAPPAVERILRYTGSPPAFATVRELEAYFRTVYAPFGQLTDVQWCRLTETSLRRLPDGRVTPHYDPAVAQQFSHHPRDYVRWDCYDKLTIPVLCLRGEHSDLLLPHVAEEMTRRGPRAEVVTVAGCGHAPALQVASQLEVVEQFLTRR